MIASTSWFDNLIWKDDRMLLGDLVFRLEDYRNDNWELGDECFAFYKIKKLVDQYARFWTSQAAFHPRNVFELGLWDGGSVVFWFECFQPQKHVGVDILDREDGAYFQRYVTSRGLQERIKTYWRTDQSCAARLREIVRNEFDGPLDLVIDDASHLYRPTKASFEALFPFLRPGGWYVIEDWAWAHWPEFQSPQHPWAGEIALTQLAFDLVEATGSSINLIGQLRIFEGLVAVERGPMESAELGEFRLQDYVLRRPGPSRPPPTLGQFGRRAKRLVRRALKRLAGI